MTSNVPPPWVIPVVPLGAVSAGVIAWRLGGKLYISPIVKTSFAFVPDGPMTPAPPVPVRTVEVHSDPKDPESSIREGLDTAPELMRAEVLFAGSAYAPSGVPVTQLTARLAIHEPKMERKQDHDEVIIGKSGPGELILEKRLEVLGDRLLLQGHPPPEPAPFTRIPMTYEHAYGGPDHKQNPVGIGVMAELIGRRRLPNIVHPARSARPGVEPAGFAPISYKWLQRRIMLKSMERSVLEQPVVEIPDNLDPYYFQSSPADQRLPDPRLPRTRRRFFQGYEWIVLEGLNTRAVLQTQLPGARGVAHVYLPDGSHKKVELVADTLFIDGDAERCTLTWRGAFNLPSIADLPSTGIVASVEWPGRPVVWPSSFPRVPPRAPDLEGYPEISITEEPAPQQPFRPGAGAPPPLPGRGAPPARPIPAPTFGAPPPQPAAQPAGRQRTVMMELDAPPPAPTAVGPKPLAATAPLPVAAPQDADIEWGLGTMVLTEAEEPAPAPPAGRGRQRTTIMGPGDIPAGFPAAGAPPAPPPPGPPAPAVPAPKFPPLPPTRQQVAVPAPPTAPQAPRPPLKKP